MQLLLVTVICLALTIEVSAAPPCSAAERCSDAFVSNAHTAGNNRENYCVYVRQKLDCLENIRDLCTPEQWKWVDSQITYTRDSDPECSAVRASASIVCLIVVAIFNSLLAQQ